MAACASLSRLPSSACSPGAKEGTSFEPNVSSRETQVGLLDFPPRSVPQNDPSSSRALLPAATRVNASSPLRSATPPAAASATRGEWAGVRASGLLAAASSITRSRGGSAGGSSLPPSSSRGSDSANGRSAQGSRAVYPISALLFLLPRPPVSLVSPASILRPARLRETAAAGPAAPGLSRLPLEASRARCLPQPWPGALSRT